MKYFFDTEFKEGFHKPLFGKNRHYIDLISIGMVGEDDSEFYAISNEFDLAKIWNDKDPWLKENVLKKIHTELCARQGTYAKTYHYDLFEPFTLKSMKTLIRWHGKSNKEIMCDLILYIYREEYKYWMDGTDEFIHRGIKFGWGEDLNHEFYAYYADYDWVLFCSLFGRMLNLPFGFPMYCRDLRQMMDEKAEKIYNKTMFSKAGELDSLSLKIKWLKGIKGYPVQENEHSALDDAKWNKELFDWLNKL